MKLIDSIIVLYYGPMNFCKGNLANCTTLVKKYVLVHFLYIFPLCLNIDLKSLYTL